MQENTIKSRDQEIMKIIHDLKNPTIAIENMVEKIESNSKLKEYINYEIADIFDMLDGLRLVYKMRYNMNIKEQVQILETKHLTNSIKSTFRNLAINGKNEFKIQVEQGFPEQINVQTALLKRMINNILSNSFKHTIKGKVLINFSNYSTKNYQFDNKNNYKFIQNINDNKNTESIFHQNLNPIDYYTIGSPLDFSLDQILIEITDNGMGIPADKLPQIFTPQTSDQSGNNWDGTGLGLSICHNISCEINAFIKYTSVPGRCTAFKIQVPVNMEGSSRMDGLTEIVTYNEQESSEGNTNVDHTCGQILIAEDNNSICRIQEKQFTKKDVPFKIFLNGKDLQDQVVNIKCKKCKNIYIMTDFSMPQMNGIELAQKLRCIKSKSFVISLVSADEKNDYKYLYDYLQQKPAKLNLIQENQLIQLKENQGNNNDISYD